MLAIFVDGPLTGVMQEIPRMPTWEVRLPERETRCTCDPEADVVVHDADAGTVVYHVVMRGLEGNVAMMSLETEERAVLDSLSAWTTAEFERPRWERHCRSRRAFT